MSWHYIKANHASHRPRRLLFFDTETQAVPAADLPGTYYQTLRLGCAEYGRYERGKLTRKRSLDFTTVDQFWQFVAELQSPESTLWIVAHNLLFDFRVVQFEDRFESCEYVIDAPRSKRLKDTNGKPSLSGRPLACLDNPPTIIGMRHVETSSRIVAVDSFNWFKHSIAYLGKMVGLPKLPMPADTADAADWLRYCRRDVDVLRESFLTLIRWADDNKVGVFRYSAAGQAMSAFRHRFMKHKICIHDNDDAKALERKGYFGGQSEVYKVGSRRGKYYHLDVTGLFPSVMRGGELPIKLLRFSNPPEFFEMPPGIDCRKSIAEVIVSSPRLRFPVRSNGRPLYVVGNFRTVLVGAELALAAKNGLITHWRRFAEYETAPIFTEYVNYFWEQRKQYQKDGNGVYEQLSKMMLNSLYGKFAQLAPKWESDLETVAQTPWGTWSTYDCRTKSVRTFRSVGWHVQEKTGRKEQKQSFVAISAFVTALAREKMRWLREIAGMQHVFYQAVDSLIVDQIGYDNLENAGTIRPGELGWLRLLRTADNIDVMGVGDYSVGEHSVMVGRKQSATMNGDGSWTQAQFDGPGSLFMGTQKRCMSIRDITKMRVSPCINGTIDAAGEVLPYVISTPLPFDSDAI